jgi:S-(hydroxymethyl)glutathione dehydrogenase/alcohol dehydrogenase
LLTVEKGSSVRAALLQEPRAPLVVVDDVEIESPRAGEVLVRLTHCGVCATDLGYVSGEHSSPLPLILGHEASGVVEEVGAGVIVPAPGQAVVLTNRPACGRCYWCVRGETHLCAVGERMLAGVYPDGGTRLSRRGATVYRGIVLAGFAERTVVPAAAAVPVPDDVPLELAAILGCAIQTGVGAVLNTARVPPGATVMVAGLGGVGVSIVQGARIAGARRIIAISRQPDRRAHATRLGATDVIDPAENAPHRVARELTGGIGVDFTFDATGHVPTIESLLKATRKGGTTVMVGLPGTKDVVSVAALGHSLYERKLIGCYIGSGNAWLEYDRLIALWRAGRLDLEGMVTARRPLEEINVAFDDMRAGRGLRTVLSIHEDGPAAAAHRSPHGGSSTAI